MKKILVLSAMSVMLIGCQSTQSAPVEPKSITNNNAECYYYGKPEVVAPNWICSPSSNKEKFIREAVGFSSDTAGGISHQKNLAVLQAQKELADQVKSEIITRVKSKVGTLGVNGSEGATSASLSEMEAIANVKLEGVEIIRSFRGPDGYFYVHVGLPRDVISQNVENVITAVDENSPKTIPQSNPKKNKQLAADIAKALGDI